MKHSKTQSQGERQPASTRRDTKELVGLILEKLVDDKLVDLILRNLLT